MLPNQVRAIRAGLEPAHCFGDLSRAADIAGPNITLFDFTALADGSNIGHLVPMTSSAAITEPRDLLKSDKQGRVNLSEFDFGANGGIRARGPNPT